MKTSIFFDIDYTLIDTDVLRPYFRESSWRWADLPYKKSVYPEVAEVLKKLKNKFKLGIFSESDNAEYQQTKLVKGGLINFFNQNLVYIGSSKERMLGSIIEQLNNKSGIFVDDQIGNLELVSSRIAKVKTVRIRRGRYASVESNYIPDYEIGNLKELLPILS